MKQRHFYNYLILIFFLSCGKDDTTIAPTMFSLTVSAGVGGSVSGTGGLYESGSVVTLTAIPESNYTFTSWSNGSTENPLILTLTGNQSIEANFSLRKYALNITVEGEGTVTEEVISTSKDYDVGTRVRLTAVPNSEWTPFKSWSGDIISDEHIIEVEINNPVAVIVKFEETNIQMSKFETLIESSTTAQDIQTTFYNVSGPLHYSSGTDHFMLYPGCVSTPQGSVKEDLHTVASQVLKKVDGQWQYFKTFEDAKFYGPRNFEVLDKYIVIGDGNEIGENFWEWQGDTFFGEILSGGDIKWSKVNDENNQGYYHGITIGDLNNDGLLDVGGTPGWYGRPSDYAETYGENAIKIFLQNNDGSFIVSDSILNYGNSNPPFTFDFANVFGDERDEIITADYGGGDPYANSELNQIRIYAFNSTTGKFELHWKSSSPTAFYEVGLGATSIKCEDFNNDGIVDISVAREGQGGAFELWLGNGDGTFVPKFASPLWTDNELQFREFWVLDANNDNYLDIILRPFHYGSLYRVNPVWWSVEQNNGIKFNHLIWLNNGDGTFSYYNKEDIRQEGINIDNVHPYMDGEYLHFVGTYTEDWQKKNLLTYDFKLHLK